MLNSSQVSKIKCNAIHAVERHMVGKSSYQNIYNLLKVVGSNPEMFQDLYSGKVDTEYKVYATPTMWASYLNARFEDSQLETQCRI